MYKDPVYNILWGYWLDLRMRIHWLGVTVDWGKVGGKEKLHSLHDDGLYYWKFGVSFFFWEDLLSF